MGMRVELAQFSDGLIPNLRSVEVQLFTSDPHDSFRHLLEISEGHHPEARDYLLVDPRKFSDLVRTESRSLQHLPYWHGFSLTRSPSANKAQLTCRVKPGVHYASGGHGIAPRPFWPPVDSAEGQSQGRPGWEAPWARRY